MCRRGALLAAIGLSLAAACSEAPPPAPPAPAEAPVREVTVVPAAEVVWERVLHATGELVPAEESTLGTKVAGRLELLAPDVGTRVEPGELVARIEAADFELRVAQAAAAVHTARAVLGLEGDFPAGGVDPEKSALVREALAELDQAQREFERQQSLVSGGAATQAALDAAATAKSAAESRLQGARETIATRRATLSQREVEQRIAEQQLADTQVRAPYAGVVSERLAGTGDFLNAGAPLAHLLRTDPVRLRVVVSEQSSGLVVLGQEVRASFDSGAPPIVAHLTRLAPALGLGDRALLAEADVPNADGVLRPGAFVRAELVLDHGAKTLAVPPASLVRFAGIDKVFVAVDDVAVERRVRVGRVESGRVEILEGLTAGEAVVQEPGKLRGGARLRVRPKD